jgi:hypothetical protein
MAMWECSEMKRKNRIILTIVTAIFMLSLTSAFANETIGGLLRRAEQIAAAMRSASRSGNFQYYNQLLNEEIAVLNRVNVLKIQHMTNDLDDSDTANFLTLRKLKRQLAEASTAVEVARVYSQVEQLRTQTLRAACFSRNPFDNSSQQELRAIENYSKLVLQRVDELPTEERNAFLTAAIGALSVQLGAAQSTVQSQSATAARPSTNMQKGYCARHNCHYELTRGCHYCDAPKFGLESSNIRGNWDGEIE